MTGFVAALKCGCFQEVTDRPRTGDSLRCFVHGDSKVDRVGRMVSEDLPPKIEQATQAPGETR